MCQAVCHARALCKVKSDTLAGKIDIEICIGRACRGLVESVKFWSKFTGMQMLSFYKSVCDVEMPYEGQIPVEIPFRMQCPLVTKVCEELMRIGQFEEWYRVIKPWRSKKDLSMTKEEAAWKPGSDTRFDGYDSYPSWLLWLKHTFP